MERSVYDRMAEIDGVHWWFSARRQIVASLIKHRLGLPGRDATILEIGAGTGSNLPMLMAFGKVEALEPDDQARELASARTGVKVHPGGLPDLPGIPDGAYDAVVLLDVLEHVEDDLAALQAISRKLKPSGRLLLTVPANPAMWSAHDVAHHHHRRYTSEAVSSLLTRANYALDYIGFFNTILFVPIYAARLLGSLNKKKGGDDKLPAKFMNAVLLKLFSLERHLVGRFSLPFGVSLAVVARPRLSD
jgi:SAM-dependent methyltransferase